MDAFCVVELVVGVPKALKGARKESLQKVHADRPPKNTLMTRRATFPIEATRAFLSGKGPSWPEVTALAWLVSLGTQYRPTSLTRLLSEYGGL